MGLKHWVMTGAAPTDYALMFEEVGADVAVTGAGFAVPAAPCNLDFTEI